jgi:hypothetical protein
MGFGGPSQAAGGGATGYERRRSARAASAMARKEDEAREAREAKWPLCSAGEGVGRREQSRRKPGAQAKWSNRQRGGRDEDAYTAGSPGLRLGAPLGPSASGTGCSSASCSQLAVALAHARAHMCTAEPLIAPTPAPAFTDLRRALPNTPPAEPCLRRLPRPLRRAPPRRSSPRASPPAAPPPRSPNAAAASSPCTAARPAPRPTGPRTSRRACARRRTA